MFCLVCKNKGVVQLRGTLHLICVVVFAYTKTFHDATQCTEAIKEKASRTSLETPINEK